MFSFLPLCSSLQSLAKLYTSLVALTVNPFRTKGAKSPRANAQLRDRVLQYLFWVWVPTDQVPASPESTEMARPVSRCDKQHNLSPEGFDERRSF